MYKLIYRATTGSSSEKDTQEYSILLENEPTQADKDHFINSLESQGKLPTRETNQANTKQYENFTQTVMTVGENRDLEVMYKRKEAKEITFYADGTYSVDEGLSHNYNDKYFRIENSPFETESKSDKDIMIANIHAETAEKIAKLNAESNEKIAEINRYE